MFDLAIPVAKSLRSRKMFNYFVSSILLVTLIIMFFLYTSTLYYCIGKMVEWIMEQRQLNEEARIKAMIINKKQLDTKDLEKRRKPLQKLDEENERKKRKQKER